MHTQGDNLTARYREIGYVHRALPVTEKLGMFFARYGNHFGPDYLLIHGDTNQRLHTGYCGELFAPTLLVLLLAIALIVCVPRFRRRRFHRLLLGGLLLSPVGAALTLEQHNSLRAFSLVVFAIPLALVGFHHGLRKARRWVPSLVLVANLLCAGAFVANYYGPYRAASIGPFEYYGMREAIVKAVRAQASRVVIDDRRHGLHADLYANFYRIILAQRWSDRLPPLQPGRPADVHPGEYFIFEDRKQSYPELREGLPEGGLFIAVPYGPALQQLGRRKKH
jgi:hypothetical protein